MSSSHFIKCKFCKSTHDFNTNKSDTCSSCLEKNEMVNHPPHYNSGQIEVIEAIEDWNLNYNRGNAVKYIARAGKKTKNPILDLEKAVWYLEREIEILCAEIQAREPVRPNEMDLKKAMEITASELSLPLLTEEQLIKLEESLGTMRKKYAADKI